MSQSSNSPDSQALLQSMLERLKLQHGKERPADGAGAIQSHHVYEFGVPTERFGVSSVDSSLSHKDGESLQSVDSFKQGHCPLPLQKDNMGVNMLESETRIFNEKTDVEAPWDSISGRKDTTTEQDQALKHNTYDWSWRSTGFTADSQGNKTFHAVNGEYASLSKWRDIQMMPKKGVSLTTRQQQRSSESKARRWTEKIKEKWKEKSGFKKGKDEAKDRSSASNHLDMTSNQDAGKSLLRQGSSESPVAQSQDDAIDAFIRSSEDLQCGFSSINLLEEIVSGQEWAKFLNPPLSAPSANQRPPEETLGSLSATTTSNDNGRPAFVPLQPGGSDGQWSSRDSESLPVYNSQASGNITEPQNHTGHSEDDQSQPMEQGQSQSQEQLECAEILEDLSPISRISRKRHYHLAVTQVDWTQGTIMSTPSSHAMDDSEVHPLSPFFRQNGASVPSPFYPSAPPPTRGVLKNSGFLNSDSSQESKRRRVEPNRRVHFAEKVEEIPPVEVALQSNDSEEDCGTDGGSVTGRRSALPAWILALKRKNSGRKHI
ncbi:uncharacterized protein zgc:113229 [Entelurus aequoreus]|uniref:uncharacterized protein zgc:113229 n=1 Tax=Entelurus aequoreus TaxID=161455 RepID=UPI002B1E0E52|nr:uncharacterized protein zgc:113229 [Entelurus aequoreus]